MPDKRLVAVVTALLLMMTSHGARADASLEQLLIIDQLLTKNDTKSLWTYIHENPELLRGDDELARELRNFYDTAAVGRLRFDFESQVSRDASNSSFSGSVIY
ncbi:hypothetical protein FGK63_18160 [Ruegeria sediminis]|uniref:Nuclear transport factor 2 family protein n=1 Tax=Ruegeria sediminis TaxID=2583820 RepID=A0ABY2WT14_9RHOB|nr:hypothetical protein [Ruegeria sediminis]TMV04212.1 hypothetical protein FGK63_18160 [Ruegeria sediminis]